MVQVDVNLPDPGMVYGLPDIPADDMALIMGAVCVVWALAWTIRRAGALL